MQFSNQARELFQIVRVIFKIANALDGCHGVLRTPPRLTPHHHLFKNINCLFYKKRWFHSTGFFGSGAWADLREELGDIAILPKKMMAKFIITGELEGFGGQKGSYLTRS